MGTTRNVNKTWGTWYTGDGERADAWPTEVKGAAGPGARPRDALLSGSVHGLGGTGPGLSNVFAESHATRSAIGGLL